MSYTKEALMQEAEVFEDYGFYKSEYATKGKKTFWNIDCANTFISYGADSTRFNQLGISHAGRISLPHDDIELE